MDNKQTSHPYSIRKFTVADVYLKKRPNRKHNEWLILPYTPILSLLHYIIAEHVGKSVSEEGMLENVLDIQAHIVCPPLTHVFYTSTFISLLKQCSWPFFITFGMKLSLLVSFSTSWQIFLVADVKMTKGGLRQSTWPTVPLQIIFFHYKYLACISLVIFVNSFLFSWMMNLLLFDNSAMKMMQYTGLGSIFMYYEYFPTSFSGRFSCASFINTC